MLAAVYEYAPGSLALHATVEPLVEGVRPLGVPEDARWAVLDAAALPSAVFVPAWRFADDGSVVADLDACRAIQRDNWRKARQPILDALDRDWMRAFGQGRTADAAAIEAQRQALRDIPEATDLSGCATPEAVLAVWPDALGPNPYA